MRGCDAARRGSRRRPASRRAPARRRHRGRARRNYNIDAPGANDDGSGTVLSMELARVFAESGIEFDATLVFMTVAGEEQGLIGAGAHAKKAKDEKIPIQAWFNNDIVGNSHGGDGIIDSATIRVYSEGPEDSPSRSLAQLRAARSAAQLRAVAPRPADGAPRSLQPRRRSQRVQRRRASPRSASASRRENYSKQHGADDTIDGVDFRYLAQNARVNAAGMATLALAPPPPVVVSVARRADDRSPAVRLRRAPALGGVAGRGRLPHLLAQRLGARLGARGRRRQRHRVHVPEDEHRRLGVRRRRGRRRRPREHGQRLRRAAAHEHGLNGVESSTDGGRRGRSARGGTSVPIGALAVDIAVDATMSERLDEVARWPICTWSDDSMNSTPVR